MSRRQLQYGPPQSDSDEEYDCFLMDGLATEKKIYCYQDDWSVLLSNAVCEGDLETVKKHVQEQALEGSFVFEDQSTLLQLACSWGQLNVVRYLVEDLKVDCNFTKKFNSPLLLVCQSTHQPDELLAKVVEYLIEHGAQLTTSDMYNNTALMYASSQGHLNVVRCLWAKGAALEARDNQGDTALFHAIEHNQPEVVRFLLEKGAATNLVNRKGYTPVQAAEFYGFNDLLEILPKKEVVYKVPTQYFSYNSLRDRIPQIFLRSDCPDYFQELVFILMKTRNMYYLEYFARGHVSLEQFLNISDEELEKLGLVLPVQRMKIKRCILRYYLKLWQEESLSYLKQDTRENFHDLLLIVANYLKHLTVLKCSYRYVKSNLEQGLMGPLPPEDIVGMKVSFSLFQRTIADTKNTVTYLASFSPGQNPIYIDYNEYLARKKRSEQRKRITRAVCIASISLLTFLRLRRFLTQ